MKLELVRETTRIAFARNDSRKNYDFSFKLHGEVCQGEREEREEREREGGREGGRMWRTVEHNVNMSHNLIQTINAYHYTVTDYGLNYILIVAYPEADFFGVVQKAKTIIVSVCVSVLAVSLVVGVSFQIYYLD